MTSPKYFTTIPMTEAEWDSAALRAGVRGRSLKSCTDLRSGSEITHEQFLLFRTLCPAAIPCCLFNSATYNLTMQMQQAQRILANSTAFQSYLLAVQNGTVQNLGSFAVPFAQQMDVIRAPNTRDSNKLATIDENSVNFSLISFLQAVVGEHNFTDFHWTASRIGLVADFGIARGDGKRRQYKAVTDGQLQHLANCKIRSIVECKRRDRKFHTPQVETQEASEVLAWTKEYPNTRVHRTVISQDGKEEYVTFPQYSDNWVRYVRSGKVNGAGFMTMHKYGPYMIYQVWDIQHVAEIALAIALQ